MAASSSKAPAARTPAHISGLWIGQAVPHPTLAAEVPVNPIQWSLTLLRPKEGARPSAAQPNLFGAGFFDDAGDIPGQPVLFYTLRGVWDPAISAVEFVKVYETSKVTEDLKVQYKGQVETGAPDGQPVLKGTWHNELEGTHGSFACRLEEA